MPISEAKKRANKKYDRAHYEQLNLLLKIGQKDEWKDAALALNISVTELV